jgi:hypothetical protein
MMSVLSWDKRGFWTYDLNIPFGHEHLSSWFFFLWFMTIFPNACMTCFSNDLENHYIRKNNDEIKL